jgi:hypothetical protein
MLKRLLYLYNDGHNPFPKLGKGGLGYHLPQYRKRMHGDGMHLINGKYEYDDDDSDLQVYDQGFITGNYIPLGNDEFIVDDERHHNNRIIKPKHIGKPEYFDTTLNENDIYDDNDDNDYYDPTKSSIPYLNTTQKILHDIEQTKIPKNKKLSKSDIKDVNEIIKKTETLIEDKDKVHIEKTINDLFMSNYGFGMVEKVYKGLKELIKNLSKDSLEYQIYNTLKIEIDKSSFLLPSDLPSLRNKFKSLSDEDFSLLKIALEDVFKKHDEKMEETKVLIEDLSKLSFEESFDVVTNNYDDILAYYNTQYTAPGKGYEAFLCGAGSCLIKYTLNDNDMVVTNFDNSDEIPEGKSQYCAVDLLIMNPKTNSGAIGEAKNYGDKDMTIHNDPENNYVAIQASKLCGNSFKGSSSNFDIVFGKDDDTKEYYIIDIRYKNKPISKNIDINDYLLSVNAQNDTWICNLLKEPKFVKKYINDKTMINYNGHKDLFKVNIDTIPKTEDYVSGSKNKIQSIRIKNKYFKQIKKK